MSSSSSSRAAGERGEQENSCTGVTHSQGKERKDKAHPSGWEKEGILLAWEKNAPLSWMSEHLEKNVSLLIIIGAEIYNLLHSLMVSLKSADKAFAEIVGNLQNHLSSGSLAVRERFCFYKENVKENEHF